MAKYKINLKEIKINIDNNDITKVKLFFDEYTYANIDNKMKNGFISLKIRYYLNIDNIESLFDIMKNYKLMKRDYIQIIIYFYNIDKNISIDIFKNKVINYHKIEVIIKTK